MSYFVSINRLWPIRSFFAIPILITYSYSRIYRRNCNHWRGRLYMDVSLAVLYTNMWTFNYEYCMCELYFELGSSRKIVWPVIDSLDIRPPTITQENALTYSISIIAYAVELISVEQCRFWCFNNWFACGFWFFQHRHWIETEKIRILNTRTNRRVLFG